MNKLEFAKLIETEIVSDTNGPDQEIERAIAADLKNVVLSVDTDKMIVFTGLANPQTI
jgi:hypothetical protein